MRIAKCFFTVLATFVINGAYAVDIEQGARLILKCYHPTASLMTARETGQWSRASDYGGTPEYSKVVEIDFSGAFTGNKYQMKVAFLQRTRNGAEQYRAVIINDSAVVPPNPNCELRDW